VTRLVARLGALVASAPGRPSLADTASLAMFSVVGAPPLAWPAAWRASTEVRERRDEADRSRLPAIAPGPADRASIRP